jgi:hypothetical protein
MALGGNVPSDLECGAYIEYLNWPNPATTACDEEDKFWESEDAMWDMEALTDGLNNLCPPFVYFGTLEGDGSDFGFWPDMDRLNEELQWERDHYPDDSIPDALELEDYNVIVQVSDHGNVTMMDMDRNVIWAVV